jgi:hypothetical protein
MMKQGGEDFIAATLEGLPEHVVPTPRGDCENPYCLDGYIDKEFGIQDGRYSWVDQVPCQICNPDPEEPR